MLVKKLLWSTEDLPQLISTMNIVEERENEIKEYESRYGSKEDFSGDLTHLNDIKNFCQDKIEELSLELQNSTEAY